MKIKFPLVCSSTKELVDNYKEYILTIHWKKIKEQYILSGLSKECYRCKSNDKPYEFYHRTYKRMGKENLLDIVPICQLCYEDLLGNRLNLNEKSWNIPRKKGKKKALRQQLKRYAFNPSKLSETEHKWMMKIQPKLRGNILSKYFAQKVKQYKVSPQWINKQVNNACRWIRKETYKKCTIIPEK